MSGQDLVVRQSAPPPLDAARGALPGPAEWRQLAEIGDALFRSGMLPGHVKSAQAATAIILKGRELGVPAMYALSNIIVINGKPTANAELMQALIYRDHGDNALRFVEVTDRVATIEYRRRAWAAPERMSYTIDEAKRAGLLANPQWQKYPPAMLRARCLSAVARAAFADSIGGLFTTEELDPTAADTFGEDDDRRAAQATTVVVERPAPLATPAQLHRLLEGRKLAYYFKSARQGPRDLARITEDLAVLTPAGADEAIARIEDFLATHPVVRPHDPAGDDERLLLFDRAGRWHELSGELATYDDGITRGQAYAAIEGLGRRLRGEPDPVEAGETDEDNDDGGDGPL